MGGRTFFPSVGVHVRFVRCSMQILQHNSWRHGWGPLKVTIGQFCFEPLRLVGNLVVWEPITFKAAEKDREPPTLKKTLKLSR